MGASLPETQTSNSAQDIDLTITRGQALLSSLDLQLQTPTFKYGSDPRELGVVLIGVEASSGAESPKPAIPNGVVLWQTLLGALILFGAGRAAGWRGTSALIATCAAVAVMALMFALDRERYAQWTWVWLVVAIVALALGSYWRQLTFFAARSVSAIRQGTLPGGNELRIAKYEEPGQSAMRPLPALLPALLVFAALAISLLHPLIALLPRDIIDTTSFSTDYTNFSWGLAYYTTLPAWLAWGGIALVFIFAIPQVNRRVTGWLSSLWGYVAKRLEGNDTQSAVGASQIRNPQSAIRNPYALLVVAGLSTVALLWLLRARGSMGDSSELLAKIAAGSMWREREPLDYYIHFKLFQTLAGLGVTPLEVYQWVSVLAGGLLVVGIVLVACLLAPPGRRWLVAGLGLATGNLLLFAGYVESYTLDTLGLVWFLVACLLYLRGSAPPAVPAFVLAVTMWLHPQTSFLLPALLVALLLKQESWAARVKEAGVMLATALSVSMVVATIFLIEGYSWERWQIARTELGGIDPGTFKPLFQTTGPHEYYPIFSLAHLGAIIQEQLRLAPLALIICLAVLLSRRWIVSRQPATTGPASTPTVQPTSAIAVLAAAAISTFAFSITWNPDLGASSDWDLLSLCGIPLSLLAGTLLVRVWPGKSAIRNPQSAIPVPIPIPYTSTLAYCGSVLVAAAAWHTLSWLLANALALPY